MAGRFGFGAAHLESLPRVSLFRQTAPGLRRRLVRNVEPMTIIIVQSRT
jgi:hypothetical protein